MNAPDIAEGCGVSRGMLFALSIAHQEVETPSALVAASLLFSPIKAARKSSELPPPWVLCVIASSGDGMMGEVCCWCGDCRCCSCCSCDHPSTLSPWMSTSTLTLPVLRSETRWPTVPSSCAIRALGEFCFLPLRRYRGSAGWHSRSRRWHLSQICLRECSHVQGLQIGKSDQNATQTDLSHPLPPGRGIHLHLVLKQFRHALP